MLTTSSFNITLKIQAKRRTVLITVVSQLPRCLLIRVLLNIDSIKATLDKPGKLICKECATFWQSSYDPTLCKSVIKMYIFKIYIRRHGIRDLFPFIHMPTKLSR